MLLSNRDCKKSYFHEGIILLRTPTQVTSNDSLQKEIVVSTSVFGNVELHEKNMEKFSLRQLES